MAASYHSFWPAFMVAGEWKYRRHPGTVYSFCGVGGGLCSDFAVCAIWALCVQRREQL